MARKPEGKLRRGWTTGACATAATKAAYTALLTNHFPDPVTITLPKGEQPAFALCREEKTSDMAMTAIVKDAGDDPDVTHRAIIVASVRHGLPGSGVVFHAGEGVGMVTKPGLPVPPGEPAINPVPRQLMQAVIAEVAAEHSGTGDVEITISIPGGETLAQKTWNPRLGIVGGLSILGTTGVVVPFSCSSWIHSIHRGIDVAIATGRSHVAGCTGSTSEKAVMDFYGLGEGDMLDMGDFAGGMLKYLRNHSLPRLTIGGGFGKLTKLAMGHLDLHSSRSQVDMNWLAERLRELGASSDFIREAETANTANQILTRSLQENIPLAERIARLARDEALKVLKGETAVDVILIDRPGKIIARSEIAS
ncbi:cobalt-precorrin-5B (C(1))-methyltransferase [Kiloniella laminariae]|uniref:Cobalt-precorrin-5B C(1)-methyltransferase n=1 Tax=Kiloniella laminariae TaxID=454162 RepID=A0ABT4LHZ0_9PROT|nr:cobalt-precorrin-5B (C(1))-methyltransferase [Kiloniella laminariae]MCZ4280712.1 cobalt-precorrin-5B (C(1))-methyltransferase [Kiloniella laminariae]